MLNIAYNLLAGGTCLEHLELLRSDEAYLDALGARRIPDPTTAGDFCRRFDAAAIFRLQAIFNATRLKVWRQQPKAFFEEAILDADGTMAETTRRVQSRAWTSTTKASGVIIPWSSRWPTRASRSSWSIAAATGPATSRPPSTSTGRSPCAAGQASRRSACAATPTSRRPNTWTAGTPESVRFVFGIDATKKLYALAGDLPQNAWKTLVRRAKYEVKTKPRRRPENVKQQVVEAREFEDIRLVKEHVAEFRYRPAKCKKEYRVVVVWKELDVYRGQKKLFDDARCFFYITNDWEKPAEEIVFEANGRCNQENLLAQLKGDVRSLTAPVDNLLSNWAYMVMGSLAWSLKAWAALLLPEEGRWQEKHREEKRKLLRMDFSTFRRAMMKVPAQILSTGRRIVYRLLAWNPWQHVFFRLLDQLRQPLRC